MGSFEELKRMNEAALEEAGYLAEKETRRHEATWHPADIVLQLDAENIILILESIKKQISNAIIDPKQCHPDCEYYKWKEHGITIDRQMAVDACEALKVFFEGYVPR